MLGVLTLVVEVVTLSVLVMDRELYSQPDCMLIALSIDDTDENI
jgi:hypothetical protein